MNKFEDLIEKLGTLLSLTLHAEQGFLCRLRWKGLSLQLEYDESKDELLLASLVGSLVPGRFREEILFAALKANQEERSFGLLSYLDTANELVLQLYHPLPTSAQDLLGLIELFVEKAKLWQQAIIQGNLALVTKPASSSHISPLQFQ